MTRVPLHSRLMVIREASHVDWQDIYPFFRSIVDKGETYAYPADLSVQEAEHLWMEQPPGLTVVAVQGDVIVGSAKMGPNRPGRGSHVATASFMVHPDYQGQSVGRSLGNYVLAWAREHGYRSIQFNAVVETNAAAVQLWRSLGFTILTTIPEAFDHPEQGLVGLHVMHMTLGERQQS